MLPAVFVDYAHTDDALRNVLDTLSEVKGTGRLIVLFGCGGDRDRTKRPRMARAAAEFADAIVVTSDNPRTEDPRQIIDDVLAGFDVEQLGNVNVVTDRRRAIADAISRARPDDIVLLAGKGHEDYQIIGTEKKPFDDRLVAAKCLQTVTGASLAKGDRMA
jgi:UDP-N-acetylmuramoyl-L-alanyl-D-glutamate--2,6-diaminopimelate ligase